MSEPQIRAFSLKRLTGELSLPERTDEESDLIDIKLPLEERLELIRAILSRSVGKIHATFELDGQTIGSYGSGFVYKDRSYMVVTAQHCVNVNFGIPPSQRIEVAPKKRSIQLKNSRGEMRTFDLTDAIYFSSDAVADDIAIVKFDKDDCPELNGTEIELVEDTFTPADDGMMYFVGYPADSTELQVTAFDYASLKSTGTFSNPTKELESQFGRSGGLLFIINQGKIKALTIGTSIRAPFVGHGNLTFNCPTIQEFQTTLAELLQTAFPHE